MVDLGFDPLGPARRQSVRTTCLGLGVGKASASRWDGRQVDAGYIIQRPYG